MVSVLHVNFISCQVGFVLSCLHYRYCTVLLVLNNSVSNLTNLYLFNQKVENLRIQTLPSNSPFPIPWPRDVCLELSYLQPPLWKNPGSAPGSSWIWITKSHFLFLSANAMVSCKYVFHAGPSLFACFLRDVQFFTGPKNEEWIPP